MNAGEVRWVLELLCRSIGFSQCTIASNLAFNHSKGILWSNLYSGAVFSELKQVQRSYLLVSLRNYNIAFISGSYSTFCFLTKCTSNSDLVLQGLQPWLGISLVWNVGEIGPHLPPSAVIAWCLQGLPPCFLPQEPALLWCHFQPTMISDSFEPLVRPHSMAAKKMGSGARQPVCEGLPHLTAAQPGARYFNSLFMALLNNWCS